MKENHNLQSNHRLNKNQKVAKRSLALTTGTEEFSREIDKDLSDFSPSSATSDSSVLTFSPPFSSEACSDIEISTSSDDVSMERFVFHKTDGSVEVDIESNFLQKARNQVLTSSDVDKQSKELVDALVKIVLGECYALPDERNICGELVSERSRTLFLCILLCSSILSMIFFFGLLSDGSFHGPLPT